MNVLCIGNSFWSNPVLSVSFISALENVTNDTQKQQKITEIVSKLPTSDTRIDSFFVKYSKKGRTSKEIASEIAKSLSIEIDRKKMSVADIKNFGEYTAEIKLYQGITAKITVKVTE